MGLLSVLDVLLNVPMREVLKEIPVDEEIKKALLGLPSRYRPVFEVVQEQFVRFLDHAGLSGISQSASISQGKVHIPDFRLWSESPS